MGWLPLEEVKRIRLEALALTEVQRRWLTWDAARKLCPQDTLAIAAFKGVQDRGGTPWEAVVKANLLPDNC